MARKKARNGGASLGRWLALPVGLVLAAVGLWVLATSGVTGGGSQQRAVAELSDVASGEAHDAGQIDERSRARLEAILREEEGQGSEK